MTSRTATIEAPNNYGDTLLQSDHASILGSIVLRSVRDAEPVAVNREMIARVQTNDYVHRVFGKRAIPELTSVQAAFALQEIEGLYAVTKTEEQVQERVRERLCLHFAGLSDSEIAKIYNLDQTSRQISVSRAATIDALQKDYSPEELEIVFDQILQSTDGPTIAELAIEVIENLQESRLPEQDDILPALITEDPKELEWQEYAICAQTDPEAFFPEKGGSTREAKKYAYHVMYEQNA